MAISSSNGRSILIRLVHGLINDNFVLDDNIGRSRWYVNVLFACTDLCVVRLQAFTLIPCRTKALLCHILLLHAHFFVEFFDVGSVVWVEVQET